jgi:hypothetical protein
VIHFLVASTQTVVYGGEMTSGSELIHYIERFCDRHCMSDTAFGRRFTGNPNFIPRLRNGRDVYSKTEKRIRQEMADYDALTLKGIRSND